MPRCPRCRYADARPSRRRWYEWLLLPCPVRPFRCRDCGHRFWRPVWAG